jgi:LPXTG-motif cell wall-anchored protein
MMKLANVATLHRMRRRSMGDLLDDLGDAVDGGSSDDDSSDDSSNGGTAIDPSQDPSAIGYQDGNSLEQTPDSSGGGSPNITTTPSTTPSIPAAYNPGAPKVAPAAGTTPGTQPGTTPAATGGSGILLALGAVALVGGGLYVAKKRKQKKNPRRRRRVR